MSTKQRNLDGKTAIVTGSSRGIGAGIAIELAERGVRVVVNHVSPRSAKSGEQVVEKITAAGRTALLVQADLASMDGIQKLVQETVNFSLDKKIDIVVHNAAFGDDCYLEDVTEEFYYKQTDTNLKGPIFLTQAILPHLTTSGGRIVLLSSISARMAFTSQTVYAATKAGCEALARCWSAALGKKYGATVNCVNPGPVGTEMYWESDPEFLKSMEPIIEATPAAPRVGEVSDIVPLVARVDTQALCYESEFSQSLGQEEIFSTRLTKSAQESVDPSSSGFASLAAQMRFCYYILPPPPGPRVENLA
ncbi:hypothetical protein UA08_08019 [Talaromyces atroroseus]|uniref:Ketoreductase domain-containing protein n=1 Tax=Talaromyces atroroseus TaxID=1441469 RepID=A0A225AMS2_TALAT|nr:hypothetical protein UA08_08019 [Talaromyces atroroseus]OKL56889.1 hypothetical protein UA08_08019 [Talaromyces atroroseus]